MKTFTNHTGGMRGVNLTSGVTQWIESGASVEIDPRDIAGDVPDLGKAPTKDDAEDAALVEAVQAENADLKKRVAELEKEVAELKKAAGPDYERDNLKDVDLHKPATSKDMLLVIAAYEGATVPEGDDATKADLIKAIEAKRKG